MPNLTAFKERFLAEIRVESKEHPETIAFYQSKYSGLLRFAPLAQARLDHIDEELISQFKAKMDRGDRFTLFEVLPLMYFRKHHLPGAKNLPPTAVTAVAMLTALSAL